MVVASLDIVGGHGVQAATLATHLRQEGYPVSFVPINPPFPRGLGWVRRCPYARTLLTQALYRPSLRRLAQSDVVHVFAASYWSFVLGPVPAILAARRLGKRVVLNYHSGEADDHLARWGRLVHPFLKMADAIVVPSRYLRGVFTRRGYITRVIPNVVDTGAFRYRDRVPLRPRLLSTRNLEPGYDVANTIRAMALLRGRYPEATLTVAGYGSQDKALRRLAASLGIEGAVRFAGRVEPAHMPGAGRRGRHLRELLPRRQSADLGARGARRGAARRVHADGGDRRDARGRRHGDPRAGAGSRRHGGRRRRAARRSRPRDRHGAPGAAGHRGLYVAAGPGALGRGVRGGGVM